MATAVQYVLEMAMSGDGNGKAWISLLHLAEYVFECPFHAPSLSSQRDTPQSPYPHVVTSLVSCSPAALA
ncbi:hypothetical protein D5086_031663 [Populus alba]|uniref:Uncharacterized protein n=1 Tax=Populus alba TaxID=43335 RepID=A0ACC4AJ60_POPAL